MKRAPAVVVRGLDEARTALAAGLPATLISTPGAASFAGCGWWRALVAAAASEHPGLVAADILDCADAPGRALEAMRIGQRLLVLEACPGRADVAEAAAASGAELLAGRPPALDLADRRQAARLAAWLAGDSVGPVG
jgi:pimeloyl-ACP methyl ester carboxylesterase